MAGAPDEQPFGRRHPSRAVRSPDAERRVTISRMTGSAATSTDAPDWGTLTLELRCPRCGYNLRLLPQPRCPECGLQFAWAEVVAAAQRKLDCPLFEYHWRDRPIRSFLVTIWRALLPWRLWTRTPIASEPQVGPLLALIPLLLLFEAICCVGAYYGWASYALWPIGAPPWPLCRALLWGAYGCMVLGHFPVPLVMWGALLIFQQTINRYHIRRAQFLRLMVLSGAALVAWNTVETLVYCGFCVVEFRVALRIPTGRWVLSAMDFLPTVAFVISVCCGLSLYLRVRCGWLMGLLSSVVAALAILTPLPVLTVLTGSSDHFYADWVGKLWPGIGQLLRSWHVVP